MITIMYPYLVVKITTEMLLTFAPYNAILTSQPMTGIKRAAFTTDLSLDEMKSFSKQQGVTLNDYTLGLLSNVFYEYFENHKEEDNGRIPENIQIGVPFSLR